MLPGAPAEDDAVQAEARGSGAVATENPSAAVRESVEEERRAQRADVTLWERRLGPLRYLRRLARNREGVVVVAVLGPRPGVRSTI